MATGSSGATSGATRITIAPARDQEAQRENEEGARLFHGVESKLQGTISRGVLGIYGVVLTAGLFLGVVALTVFISASLTSRREYVVRMSRDVDEVVPDLTNSEFVCPGSSALVHASCKVSAMAEASCTDVMDEMIARVHAQGSTWSDPHNNGTYGIVSETQTSSGRHVLMLKRRTGDDKYTDLMSFVFSPKSRSSCEIQGCSESQVASVLDYSTNYCNLHNMYCGPGSSPACASVRHEFASRETDVIPSYGAGTNVDACSSHRRGDADSTRARAARSVPDTLSMEALMASQ